MICFAQSARKNLEIRRKPLKNLWTAYRVPIAAINFPCRLILLISFYGVIVGRKTDILRNPIGGINERK